MTEQFTVQLPDRTARVIHDIAARTGRNADAVLVDLIDQSLSELPVAALSDDQVNALADMTMSDADEQELADLLDDQREGSLDQHQRLRLDELLQAYRRGMVRKSEALKVAIQRGLRPELGLRHQSAEG